MSVISSVLRSRQETAGQDCRSKRLQTQKEKLFGWLLSLGKGHYNGSQNNESDNDELAYFSLTHPNKVG